MIVALFRKAIFGGNFFARRLFKKAERPLYERNIRPTMILHKHQLPFRPRGYVGCTYRSPFQTKSFLTCAVLIWPVLPQPTSKELFLDLYFFIQRLTHFFRCLIKYTLLTLKLGEVDERPALQSNPSPPTSTLEALG